MKKSIILLCTVLFCFTVNAQFSVGPKAGLNIGKEKYGNNFYTTSSHVFFCGGIFANYSLKKHFATQLEVIYSGEGTGESYPSNNKTITGVVTINRINIPVLFQYKTSAGIYLETGPQIGFLISAKGKYSTGNYNFKTNTQPSLFSWCFGAGYQLSQTVPGLGISARYAAGLSQVNKGKVNGNSIKSNVFAITLFYALPCKTKAK